MHENKIKFKMNYNNMKTHTHIKIWEHVKLKKISFPLIFHISLAAAFIVKARLL